MSIQTALQEDVIVEDLKVKIDEFAKLTEFLAPYQDRYEELKKELAAEANSVKDDQKITLFGYQHKIEFSACVKSTELLVTNQELFCLYGLDGFKPDLVAVQKIEAVFKPDQSALGWKFGSRRLNKVK